MVREQSHCRRARARRRRRSARRLRGDLDAIVLQALRKEPELRYARVMNLAADIRRHLAGEPVLARRPTLVIERVVFGSGNARAR